MDLRTWGILLAAAVLEVAGDAVVREGLAHRAKPWIVLGVAVLGAYGLFFGSAKIEHLDALFGIYVAFFAVVGLIVGSTREWLKIREWRFDPWTMGGVALIVIGGVLVNHGAKLRDALGAR